MAVKIQEEEMKSHKTMAFHSKHFCFISQQLMQHMPFNQYNMCPLTRNNIVAINIYM